MRCLKISKLNNKYWRKLFVWMSIVLGLSLSSCEKEEFPLEENDEYYVKYIVTSNTMYSLSRNVKVKSENNSFKDFTYKNSKWEMTIGPVKKGFQASSVAKYVTSQNLARTYISTEIQVSINNSPFVMKAIDNSTEVRMSSSIRYTIK